MVSLPDDAVLVRALQPFDSCDTYLAYVQQQALEMVGPYGLDTGYGPPTMLAAEDAAGEAAGRAAAPTTAAPQADAAGGGRTSPTNVKEVGVDEPDILKSDGRRIVALAQKPAARRRRDRAGARPDRHGAAGRHRSRRHVPVR